MDWSQCPAVDRHPDKMGGVWCFAGTRLQVSSLFECLEDGGTIDEFLEWFPFVAPSQIQQVLEFARRSLEETQAAA